MRHPKLDVLSEFSRHLASYSPGDGVACFISHGLWAQLAEKIGGDTCVCIDDVGVDFYPLPLAEPYLLTVPRRIAEHRFPEIGGAA